MKLAGKLAGLGLGGAMVVPALYDMTKPGRSIFTALPQPKTEQEAIARQRFYDQRNYLQNNLGAPGLMYANPWKEQYGQTILSNKPLMNHNTIYDNYLSNRGY